MIAAQSDEGRVTRPLTHPRWSRYAPLRCCQSCRITFRPRVGCYKVPSHAQYCSNACRQRAYRARKAAA